MSEKEITAELLSMSHKIDTLMANRQIEIRTLQELKDRITEMTGGKPIPKRRGLSAEELAKNRIKFIAKTLKRKAV